MCQSCRLPRIFSDFLRRFLFFSEVSLIKKIVIIYHAKINIVVNMPVEKQNVSIYFQQVQTFAGF